MPGARNGAQGLHDSLTPQARLSLFSNQFMSNLFAPDTASTATANENPRYVVLARQILKIFQSENWVQGRRITELSLARQLGVSRSPVRAALEVLRSQEVVSHEVNKGYALAVSWDSVKMSDANLPGDPSSELYRTIMSERFASLLGERVSVSELVRRYSKPRALVEDVFQQMQEDGVIERGNGHYWLFKHSLVDETSFLESCRYCLTLEPAALREPGFRADSRLVISLRRQHQQLLHSTEANKSLDQLLDVDAAFHSTLADFCGNRFLSQAIRQHTRLRRMGEYEAYALRTNLDDELGEHLHILDAIQSGNMENAAQLMEQHLRNTLHRRPDIARAKVLTHRRLTRR